MTPRDFIIWLKGYLTIPLGDPNIQLNNNAIKLIVEHINTVDLNKDN